jgi:hypothetical protein
MRLWQGCHSYMKMLADTYAVCLAEYQQTEKRTAEIGEQIPVISVRLIRAIAERMKLVSMRYIEVEQEIWEGLYRQYLFAKTNHFADAMVYAYAGHSVHTSPQREFLRALALYVSSPGSLAPNEIELVSRISSRLTSLFVIKETTDEDCPYCVDLAKPVAPVPANKMLESAAPTIRYFGISKAVPKLEGIIQQNERGVVEQESRLGNQFTPDGKLTVLKHLRLYWGKELPHRNTDRKGISATIKVAHGFKTISNLVTQFDLSKIADLSEEDSAKLKERASGLRLAVHDTENTIEDWATQDISVFGMGCILPKSAGQWVKVGALCAISDQNAKQWWVGMVRRVRADKLGKVHVGIFILTKKPLAVWVRILGKGAERVSDWQSSSGSFSYDFLPVILLPDAQNSYTNATMLMESMKFVPDSLYEAMTGEKSHNLKLTKLLAEGDDYEHVSFQWIGAS